MRRVTATVKHRFPAEPSYFATRAEFFCYESLSVATGDARMGVSMAGKHQSNTRPKTMTAAV